MKTKPIAFLACRILSIIFFMRALTTTYTTVFFSFMSFYRQFQGAPEMLGVLFGLIGPLILMFGGSIILWVGADKISSRMVRGLEEEETGIQVGTRELQIAGFSIVGLILVAVTIPEVFEVILTYLRSANQFDMPQIKIQMAFLVFEKITRMVVGLLLLLGSRGLVHAIHRIRTVGPRTVDE